MPLDPLIVNSPKLDIGDPLGDYTNYLQATHYKAAADKARRAESENALYNEAYRQNTDAQGNVNQNGLRAFLAQKGIGTYIPDVQKGEGERAKTSAETSKLGAETGKVNAEAFEKTWNNYKSELSSISHDPNQGIPQLVEWTKRQFADPVMGPMLKARGQTPESAIAELTNTLKTMPFDKFLLGIQIGPEAASKRSVTQMDLGGHKQLVSINDHGNPNAQLVSDQKVTLDVNSAAKAPKTTVNVAVNAAQKGANKFAETVMEGRGKQFLALSELTQNAPQQLASLDRMDKELADGNVITGAGADVRTNLLRIAKTLGVKVDDSKLVNTEMLRQQIANASLERIAKYKASGISLTPMSDHDLKMFEATGPSIYQQPSTIRRLLQIEREQLHAGIARYQDMDSRLGDGNYTGETVKMYTPDAVPGQTAPARGGGIPAEAIAHLRQNPALAGAFDAKYGTGAAKRALGGH